jgi:NAD(P)-dependent dehydrogenase (short-subunit alcohol dehydrogenase family)
MNQAQKVKLDTSIFDLSGRVCLITGASRGIGEAGARLIAAHGAHVIVTSRTIEDCERVAEDIRAAGHSAEAIDCHIGDMQAMHMLFETVKARYGRLDILINNAAANPHWGNVLDVDQEVFQKIVDVNIRGYFFMSTEAGKIMRDQGGGVILNTASVVGIFPGVNQSVYSISKAAVINMTRSFAKECGQWGIRCNALLPGMTRTKLAGALFNNDEIYDELTSRIPLQRHAEPEEMAGTMLYLVSDASTYTTGECVIVDGGLVL